MNLQQTLRRDWLLLNSGAQRNALVAAAQSQRRAAERADVERTLQAASAPDPALLRAQ